MTGPSAHVFTAATPSFGKPDIEHPDLFEYVAALNPIEDPSDEGTAEQAA